MSRKTLILCLATLMVMILGLGVAIAFLYSGTEGSSSERSVVADVPYPGLSYVPSDALLVSCFSRVSQACKGVLSGFPLMAELSAEFEDGHMASLHKSSLTVSLHYSGQLRTLYILDMKRVTEETETAVLSFAEEHGLYAEKKESMLLMSDSETLVRSSVRHKEKGVSILDAPGFSDAVDCVSGDDVLFLSNLHSAKLMNALFTGKLSRKTSFFERVADWGAFGIDVSDALLRFDGTLMYDGEPNEFMTVLEDCQPSHSKVADVLPSYTVSAVTLPIRNFQEYASAYQSFVDSRQGLQEFKSRQNALGKEAGIMPEEFFTHLEVKEVANASMIVGSKLEKINLVHVGNADVSTLFKGSEVTSLRQYSPAVHTWNYSGFAASVFGRLFSLDDESCFTYIDGWVVSGSRDAVLEYVEKDALGYTLGEYLADAGKDGLIAEKPAVALAYISMTEDADRLVEYVKPDFRNVLSDLVGEVDCAPMVFSVGKDKNGLNAALDLYRLSVQKTKAPVYDRDTVVTVPSGPFEVRNSHTGKMNKFYQNAHGAICLRDENGKDLWGVPFSQKLCGTAQNVDYFANGKLQIAFCAGSKLYVIDRLGRYVSGFPVELGKEVTLGPDVHDFSGARKYNVMILHKDNTIQMYNLKGQKPQAWKGITAGETIKALPERLTLGNKDFWIVRTSIQTLIFPFYGGEPVSAFEGDEMIRPDSGITVVDASCIEGECYDGKKRKVKLL